MTSTRAIVLIASLSLAGCASTEPSTVEELAAASARAYNVLEPGVRAAAESHLDGLNREGSRYAGKPSFRYDLTTTHTAEYETKDGKIREKITVRTYVVRAEETVLRYRLLNIRSIDISVSKQSPFAARVECEVEEATRSKTTAVDIPPIPRDLRLVAEGTQDIEELRVAIPSPAGQAPSALPPDAPPEVRKAAVDLGKDCLASEPTRKTSTLVLTFVYSTPEKRWK